MYLKIFKAPIEVEEFNKFFNSNIVSSSQIIADGTIYLFFKPLTEIGYSKIDMIQDMEKSIQTSEAKKSATDLAREATVADIEVLKTKINEFHSNQGEYKDLDKKIKNQESQLALHDDTLKNFSENIKTLRNGIIEVIKTIE